jgi:hypothetical protein
MGNSGNAEFLPVLQKLATDEDPVIVESASWAIAQLQQPRPKAASTP